MESNPIISIRFSNSSDLLNCFKLSSDPSAVIATILDPRYNDRYLEAARMRNDRRGEMQSTKVK